jgi:gamma-glutamylcyclotransferase (GGCT)/AIG2-like uncharacterized protein YtfP
MKELKNIAELKASITATNHCMMVATTLEEYEMYASRRAALTRKLESKRAWLYINHKQRQKIPTTQYTLNPF